MAVAKFRKLRIPHLRVLCVVPPTYHGAHSCMCEGVRTGGRCTWLRIFAIHGKSPMRTGRSKDEEFGYGVGFGNSRGRKLVISIHVDMSFLLASARRGGYRNSILVLFPKQKRQPSQDGSDGMHPGLTDIVAFSNLLGHSLTL